MSTTISAAPVRSTRLRSIFGGSVGNLVEWYDWYTYAAFAIYFAPSFFPEEASRTAQLFNTAAVFAIGFLIRPVGGWVLGRYADRRGRKAALTLSVLLMCAGSLIIAIAPTYAAVGPLAPALLLLARLLQGFSVGGEYGASATYISEIATPEHRGFYSGVLYITLVMGQLLALLVLIVLQFVFLTPDQLEAWGWRIPFLIGAAAALVALYLRRNLSETDAFRRKASTPDSGALLALLRYPRQVLTVVGLTMGGTLFFYVFTTYMQKFLLNTVGLTKGESTLVSAASLFLFMLLQPTVGAVSDRVGRRPMLITFGVVALVTTVPLMSALAAARDAWTAFALVLCGLVISSLYSSISAVVKAELFPVDIRALGVGLPYAVTVSVFGGTAESVALWFKLIGHEALFYWYVTACVFVSLLVYVFMAETKTAKM